MGAAPRSRSPISTPRRRRGRGSRVPEERSDRRSSCGRRSGSAARMPDRRMFGEPGASRRPVAAARVGAGVAVPAPRLDPPGRARPGGPPHDMAAAAPRGRPAICGGDRSAGGRSTPASCRAVSALMRRRRPASLGPRHPGAGRAGPRGGGWIGDGPRRPRSGPWAPSPPASETGAGAALGRGGRAGRAGWAPGIPTPPPARRARTQTTPLTVSAVPGVHR